MPEYAADVPLWGCDWESLGLSVELLDALRAWQAEFDESFDSFDSHNPRWTEVRDRWAQTGRDLAARLRAEVPPELEVVIDLWPVDDAD